MARPGRKPGKPKTGGRAKGTPNKATREVKELALEHAPAVLEELVRLALHADSEASRVAAIREVLDRAYGKPAQVQDHSGKIEHDHKHHHSVEPLSESAQWLAKLLGGKADSETEGALLH